MHQGEDAHCGDHNATHDHRPGRGTAFDFGEKILLPRTMSRVCLTWRSGKIETPFAWKDAVSHQWRTRGAMI
jgi:hypothetical protein